VERHVDAPSQLSIWTVAEMGKSLAGHRASQTLVIELPPWWHVATTLLFGEINAAKRLVTWIAQHAKANDTHAALRAAPGDEVSPASEAWAAAQAAKTQEQTFQCILLRKIVDNPFDTLLAAMERGEI
jgi:hypothetical protein